ncbi:MAG: ribosome biogenesis GTPase Der [Candidatus Peribacteraceae bacterium]|nr:ribosome biogenesis GTPase Der [Candidatus Peribacteraceae bacterium]MDD5074431.1 ribosome biogenesis GTPase Der [Candidatus Peribacteraceae bacterium]
MSQLPTVAIIGRPNTGKSTLFNRLIGKRKAIESEVAGTTRDHIAERIETDSADFLLVDTGGMGGGTKDKDFEGDVHRQSLLALEQADLILFTINGKEELTASDHEVVNLLRRKRRRHVPVLLVVTKCDNPKKVEPTLPQYLALGIADVIIPVSAPQNTGIGELMEHIEQELKKLHFGKVPRSTETDLPKIAVIGKPNVGKSSLINTLMAEPDRAHSPLLVSEIAGTTRDASDRTIRFNDRDYLFIDTAGIRRRTKMDEGIETFAYFRSIQALQECDVAVLLLDATEPISHQDQRIAGMAMEEGKGLIILLNKIDLLKGEEKKNRIGEIERTLDFARFAPLLPCSTVTREGLLKIFPLIEKVQLNRTRRIGAHDLNQWYRDALVGPPLGELGKSKHITQADAIPPTFVVFVKNPRNVAASHLRYLENRMRSTFDFTGTPIKWIAKDSNREK